jgi:hypothetical protein
LSLWRLLEEAKCLFFSLVFLWKDFLFK